MSGTDGRRRGWRASAIVLVVFGTIGLVAVPPGGEPGLVGLALTALLVDVVADSRLRSPVYWYVSAACFLVVAGGMVAWLVDR